MMELLYLMLGVVVGAILSYLMMKIRTKEEVNAASTVTMNAEKEKAVLLQQVDGLRVQLEKAEQIVKAMQTELIEVNASKVKAETVAQAMEARLTEHRN